MKIRRITVGGLPGTGTSTLCRILKDRLELTYTYAGQLFRDSAAERGMSLAEFGALCQQDETVDRELDARQLALLETGPILLEGRLSGVLAAHNDVPALKVWLTCDVNERVRRIIEREGGDIPKQMSKLVARESSEADRYQRYYGIDMADQAPYDLVLDSTRASPTQLADAVVVALEALETS
jgi:cytidylate kinase